MSDAPPGNEPINVARPQWRCPHCKRDYYSDLASATECAQAGPPPPAPDGVPVLVLPSYGRTTRADGRLSREPRFGLTEAGPVAAELVDGTLRHRRDVKVDGAVIDANDLPSDRSTDLVVLVNQRAGAQSGVYTPVQASPWSRIPTLFQPPEGQWNATAPVWPPAPDAAAWLRAPDEQERAVLNMLTGNLLDSMASLDVDEFATRVEASYRGRGNRHSGGLYELVNGSAALVIAEAHGAPSHIWAMRWLSAHTSEVAYWHAQTAIAWAAGTGGPLPAARGLAPVDRLPKNPGKRRLALMAPYDTETYWTAAVRVVEQLTVDAPTRPVPHLGDVVTELHQRKEVSP